jgi:hypothetical protein
MKSRTRGSRAKLHLVGKPCVTCPSDPSYALLSAQEVMALPTTDSLSYSLKVYVGAFLIGMQEFTGDAYSIEACGLLDICAEEIARGHRIEIR